jgi:hypothetical protein
MEALLLSNVPNQESTVGSAQRAASPTRRRSAHCAPPTAFFVTFSVEIDGDTPLFLTEAVDD